jgi:hypothetical protein
VFWSYLDGNLSFYTYPRQEGILFIFYYSLLIASENVALVICHVTHFFGSCWNCFKVEVQAFLVGSCYFYVILSYVPLVWMAFFKNAYPVPV